ncbi:unnamed protein product [Musa hybrid cultivar]
MAPNEVNLRGADMGFFPPVASPFPAVAGGDDKSNSQGGEEEGGDGSPHGNEQQHRLCARGHWRPAEDAKLKELVSQFGPQNWNLIAEKLEGRSGKSCRLRWFNQLDPKINRNAFSEVEEERLLAAHRLYGNKWALIARLFPGRTDNAVKNHWHVIMARKQREQSNAYRRSRRPSVSPSCALLTQPLPNNNNNNNACSGESTVTSTRDESASTGADLSLSSFTSRIVPSVPDGHIPSQILLNGKRCVGRFGDSGGGFSPRVPRMLLPGVVDELGCTGSASEEVSVTYHMSNDLPRGETTHGSGLTFIDFLGVGAT